MSSKAVPLRLAGAPLAHVWAHARAEYPNECCGLLLGPEGGSVEVSEAISISNIQERLHAEDPAQHPRDARTAYYMDPAQQLGALKDGGARGLALRGFYHSHPDHGVYFSEEDRRLAAPWGEPLFEGVAYVVVSVTAGAVAGASQFVWDADTSDYVEVAIPSPPEPATPSGEGSMDRAPSRVVDARGRSAALALIATRDGLHGLGRGELLEVLADDRVAAQDTIPGYCEKRRYAYELKSLGDLGFSIRIAKAE